MLGLGGRVLPYPLVGMVPWVAGFAGLLGMGVLGAAYLMKAVWLSEAFAVFGVAACVPVLMVVLRAARGHFSRELTEP